MSPRIPKNRLHKGSGQALVQIDGQRIYLGKHGSAKSKEKYQRIIAEWLVSVRDQKPEDIASPTASSRYELSINEMLLADLKFAERYYAEDGRPTKEIVCMKHALPPLRKLYGTTRVRGFGPLALKAVREYMITVEDLSRGVVNHRVNRIKRVFKWAVSEELIPASVHEGLRFVAGLRQGRTEARETERVMPVDGDVVEATLPFVPPQIAAMVQLQRLTGMRPWEVVIMRPCDIERAEEVWIYTPSDHKNRWRGHSKEVPLGPRVQAVLLPFLDRSSEAYCFSPQEAMEWHWHPNQIRHTRGTEIRKKYGMEAAQVSLGHARADVTQVYAERNLELARRIAMELG